MTMKPGSHPTTHRCRLKFLQRPPSRQRRVLEFETATAVRERVHHGRAEHLLGAGCANHVYPMHERRRDKGGGCDGCEDGESELDHQDDRGRTLSFLEPSEGGGGYDSKSGLDEVGKGRRYGLGVLHRGW